MADLSPWIFRIQRFSIHDGPGIRTTLFFQGCPLTCLWCHNPESQAMPVAGSSRILDPSQAMPPDLVPKIMAAIEKDLIFYDDSGGGVTFSGGEPLCRPDLVMALAARCREKQIHTCLDTSGAVPWQVLEKAAKAVDLILYDIKAVDPDLHTRLTGRTSAQILENLERLSRDKCPVVLRYPFIPGCTDSLETQAALGDFLVKNTRFRRLHILPFHPTAAGKYTALGKDDPMAGTAPPEAEAIETAARRFRTLGFETHIGG